MSEMIESKNKALVLKAFDTLFNQRDYAAAERYWSPDYIQHSTHIAPGREGLFDLIKSTPPTLGATAQVGGRSMANVTYAKEITALLVMDPYNECAIISNRIDHTWEKAPTLFNRF